MSKSIVDFHVESQDYFGSLATVLCLIRQAEDEESVNAAILEGIEKDLLYLQQNFLIVRKSLHSGIPGRQYPEA
jgi:hypothetical protein